MKEWVEKIKIIIEWIINIFSTDNLFVGSILAMSINFLGGYDNLLDALMWLIILDYISGIIKAMKLKELSSKIGKIGIIKKFLMFLMIGVCVKLDLAFNLNDQLSSRYLIICLLIGEEIISCSENLDKIGIPYFGKIRELLLQNKK